MPVSLNNEQVTRRYSDQAKFRAHHHGRKVEAVVPSLIGYVKAYADPGSIVVRAGLSNEMGNVAWANFKGRRIAFAYNHSTGNIDVRDRSQCGTTLIEINDATSQSQLLRFFRSL